MKYSAYALLAFSLLAGAAASGDDQTKQRRSVPRESGTVVETRSNLDEIFNFPISRALGIELARIDRPQPKLYHFTFPIMR